MKVLVVDNGLCVEFARTLANSGAFHAVGYYSPYVADFPELRDAAPGSGFPELVREYQLFEAIPRYDAFAFPDLYYADLQDYLELQGMPVWGAHRNEELELDRSFLLSNQADCKMPTPKSHIITLGEAYDTAKPGDFLKISRFRGDTETIKVGNDDVWYHDLMLRWGPMAKTQIVIRQRPLPDGPEVGSDCLIQLGKIVRPMLAGYEIKDKAYIGRVCHSLPPTLKAVLDKCVSMMNQGLYSQFLSTEILNGTLIDITTRVPQPPGDLHLYMWTNLSHNIALALHGSEAQRLTPRNEWGCQLILHSNEPEHYICFNEHPEHLYLRRAFVVNSRTYLAPRRANSPLSEVGSIVGTGWTAKDAINNALKNAKDTDLPEGISYDKNCQDELLEKLEEGNKDPLIALVSK